MHYEVNYDKLAPADRDAAAIADIRDWLGQERDDRLCETFAAQEQPMSQEDFAVVCSFAGIQGLPVQAWYRSLWPRQATVDHAVDFQYHRIGHD